MIYRTYGTTGVEVSAIGFGGMRFRDQEDLEGCAALVRAAHDAGITYFDTAPGYGRSEEIFGRAFREMLPTREQRPFHVATKTVKAAPDEVRRDLETSLQRMGLEHIDFYHVWCILTLDAFRERREKGLLRELERIRDEGLVRHICVSTHMTGADVGTMLRDYPFAGVLLGYSAMNFAYRTEGLDAAAALGRAVVVMNPLGGGLIPQHPERFGFLCTSDEETVVEGALRFLLADDRITVALVGLSDEAQLAEAVRAADGLRPLTVAQLERIRSGLSESFNELCTSCRYCDVCPEGIKVPELMEAYSQYLLTGEVPRLTGRLRYHWGVTLEEDLAADCTLCGACEDECTQRLPIRERLRELSDRVRDHLQEEARKAADAPGT